MPVEDLTSSKLIFRKLKLGQHTFRYFITKYDYGRDVLIFVRKYYQAVPDKSIVFTGP